MTIGGLAGAVVASRPELATAPIAAMFLGNALCTIPASMLMQRIGRRKGFMLGAALGVSGGCVAAFGMLVQSLATLAVGTLLVGAYLSFAQFYRFAAAEVAEPSFRPKAISLVLAGGVVAALLGPWLGSTGARLLTAEFSASFFFLTTTAAVALVLLSTLRITQSASSGANSQRSRPLQSIVRQPAYLVALLSAASAYGVMVLAMTATPLAMVNHHHGLPDASTVIQLHVLGMFLPSFVTGSLISRFGVIKVMLSGAFLLTSHVVMTLTGTGFTSFAVALVLLGVGWNFMYVGGTTLLTTTYQSWERAKAQAFNDLSVFFVALLSSLAAAPLLRTLDWQTLNVVLLPWLGAAALALLWLGMRQRTSVPARPAR